MRYFKILSAIRSITGARSAVAFPLREPLLCLARSEAESAAVVFVQDASLSRQVLQSSSYQQYNFLASTLEASDPSKFFWIRRFCDVGLIMIDGEEHRLRRQAMARFLEQCFLNLDQLDGADVARHVCSSRHARPLSSHHLAQSITEYLFSRCVACLAGLGDELRFSGEDLAMIDFFNPFPTRSTLSVCETALERCAEKCGLKSLSDDVQAAIISLLVMGVRPTIALFTAAINHCSQALSVGQTLDQVLLNLDEINSHSVVPTNFVMRKCVAGDELGDTVIHPGDILYVFLGTASGCPFTGRHSLPFGGGAHYCSGAKLTVCMLQVLKRVLVELGAQLHSLECSPVRHGYASAFLAFEA
jgi:hypothetical protein